LKVFLVFFAILILNISFLCQWSDMDRYAVLQKQLKILAEEAASGAALLRDETEYSFGRICIDSASAEAYVEHVLAEAEDGPYFGLSGQLAAELILFDDVKGYCGAEAHGVGTGEPAAVVVLSYQGRDLFRLPFLSVTEIRRTAVYEWAGGLTSSF